MPLFTPDNRLLGWLSAVSMLGLIAIAVLNVFGIGFAAKERYKEALGWVVSSSYEPGLAIAEYRTPTAIGSFRHFVDQVVNPATADARKEAIYFATHGVDGTPLENREDVGRLLSASREPRYFAVATDRQVFAAPEEKQIKDVRELPILVKRARNKFDGMTAGTRPIMSFGVLVETSANFDSTFSDIAGAESKRVVSWTVPNR